MKDEPMRPATETELAEIVRDTNGALAIRGGGTRTISPTTGSVLDTAGLSGVVLYEPAALTLVVQAGTPLSQVEAVLAAERQRLAFEVPDMGGLLGAAGASTIGGVVAANASGPRRVQVGACRDALIGVRFVDGRGTVIKNGGRVMKNVTGLDLVKLMAGSWGVLGVLTEVAFKLQAVPEAEATLLARGLDARAAAEAMTLALGSPFDVTGAAVIAGQTLLRLEGMAGSVTYRAQALRQRLGPGWDVLGGAESAVLWRAVRDVAPFASQPGAVWKLSVKPSDAPGLLADLAPLGADVVQDWGGGLIWLRIEGVADAGAALIRGRLTQLGGHATLVRGAPRGVSAYPPEAPGVAALTAGLRARFDPRGIFNPGVMG